MALLWYFPILFHVTIYNLFISILNYCHSKDLLYVSLEVEVSTKFEKLIFGLKHILLMVHSIGGIILGFIAFICFLIQKDFISSFFTFFILFIVILWQFYCFKTIKVTQNMLMNRSFMIYSVCILVLGSLFSILVIGVTIFPTVHIMRRVISDLNNKPPGKLYNVNGHLMHLRCTGNGSPVVLFEHGYSGSSLDWSHIQPIVSNTTKSCSYDRSGYGWSESGPEPRDSNQISNELKELIEQANIKDDLILVGHSCKDFSFKF
jgi:hypothetical protein